MKLIKSLQQYGLNEKEAKVYVALLKLVEATTVQIATCSEIPRGTIYHVLESLKEKGLVREIKKRNIRHFTPESPQILLTILEDKKAVLEPILPQLNSLIGHKDLKPEVALFLGKKGIKRVYNDIFETLQKQKQKRLFAISHPILFTLLPKFFPDWVQRRKKANIFSYIIAPDTKETRLISKKYTEEKVGEIKFLPQEYSWEGAVNIYGAKVALFSFAQQELAAVIVENRTLAELFKTFFQFNWQRLQ